MPNSTIFRYYLKESMKTALLFLMSFSLLYILLDYSIRFKWFSFSSISFSELAIYYLFSLSSKAYILLPFAYLLAFIRVLSHANIQKEFIALLSGGLSYRLIFRPFAFFVALGMILLYTNIEFLQPQASAFISKFEDQHFMGFSKGKKQFKLHMLKLQDDTRLIYKDFHPSSQTLENAYWIQSFDRLVHIQKLDLSQLPPTGYLVDVLEQNEKNEFVKRESYPKILLEKMHLDPSGLTNLLLPIEDQSLSTLFVNLPKSQQAKNDEQLLTQTYFHYKLSLPLVFILCFIFPAPYLLEHRRNQSLFLLFACFLFAFLAFFMVSEACLILASSGVIAPLIAIWLPQTLFLLIAFYKFRELL